MLLATGTKDDRSRGKFRPRLKQLISNNASADVKSATQNAFKELGSRVTTASAIKGVKTLSELKGVGPATATMVLQAMSDDVPFMSDEAMLQVFNADKTKLKYDIKTCEAFINKINEVVKRLKNGNILLISWLMCRLQCCRGGTSVVYKGTRWGKQFNWKQEAGLGLYFSSAEGIEENEVGREE